jgi:hypothetical protein
MKKLALLLLLIPHLLISQNSWFDLEVQFDFYGPSESFSLLTQSGDTLVNFTPSVPYENYQALIQCDSGDVNISLYDSFGDGWVDAQGTDTYVKISNPNQGLILDLDANIPFTQLDTIVNLLSIPPPIYGCMDSTALNYDLTATVDDNSCTYPTPISGCIDPTSSNFNPWATVDDYSCLSGPTTCSSGESSLQILFTPDQWPQETSWVLYDSTGTVVADAPQGTYSGATAGVPISTYICVDELQDYYLEINDSYGDGLGGSTSGGTIDGNLQVFDCTNNILYNLANEFTNSNFGTQTITSPFFIPAGCVTTSPVEGCMDPLTLEFDPLAVIDDTSCVTLRIQGCTDPSSFNYDPNANTSEVIEGFYTLQILDGASDGWGGTWLGLRQGNWISPQYQMGPNDGNSMSFPVQLNAYQPVYAYVFTTQQSILSISQIAFNLTGPEGDTIMDVIYWDAIPFPFILESDSPPTFGETCIPVVLGCTDPTSFNYDLLANTDDGSCVPVVVGCMNPLAFNFDPTANVDDPSLCIPIVVGCMDPTSFNYNPNANTNDPSLCIPVLLGCTDPTSFNYDANANTDDNSCIPVITGCTDATAFNYNPNANTDDGSCIATVLGCTDPQAFNYDPTANTDDGSCIAIVYGCTDPSSFNYNSLANVDNGSCEPYIFGCMDTTAFNFNPLANTDDGSCVPVIFGCTDPSALNYDINANTEDFSCVDIVYGCMDYTAVNYDPLANVDNGSCIVAIIGCTDPNSFNYNPEANVSDPDLCLYDAGCVTGPGEPYWLNNNCYAWVIDVDNYCCDNSWDPICQELYNYCENGWPEGESIDGKFTRFSGVIVYPNPVKNILTISTDLDVTTTLYDVTGRSLRSNIIDKEINLQNLPSGIYFLRIEHEGNIYNKRIIKE